MLHPLLAGRASAADLPPARRLLAQAADAADRSVDPRVRHPGDPRAGPGAGSARCEQPAARVHRRNAGRIRRLELQRRQPAPACSLTCITIAPRRRPTNSRACATPRSSARAVTPRRPAAYHAGASEFEVHQAYCSAIDLREQELPYGNIVAFGTGAAVLHYTTLGRRRDVPRPTFLIDAGAQFRGYASDITRTHAARTGVDAQFLELLAGMDALQLQLCAAVQPGHDYREMHLQAHRLIADLLCRERHHRRLRCRNRRGVGRFKRVLPARHRAPARPAGARRGGTRARRNRARRRFRGPPVIRTCGSRARSNRASS